MSSNRTHMISKSVSTFTFFGLFRKWNERDFNHRDGVL